WSIPFFYLLPKGGSRLDRWPPDGDGAATIRSCPPRRRRQGVRRRRRGEEPLLGHGLARLNAQLLCQSVSILRVRLCAEANPPQLDFLGHTFHRAVGVGIQPLALLLRHQAEQVAGLSVVVIARALVVAVVAVGVARDFERR